MAEDERLESHDSGMVLVAIPGRLTATLERTPADQAWCRLRGDVDWAAVEALRPALEEVIDSGVSPLVVDLRAVEFFDSSGLNLLLTLRTRAESAGLALELASLSPAVTRVFEITGAGAIFVIREPARPNDSQGRT
ncbi:STAS domain-containing protein [Catenulispora yoronensis]|uniref:Anti-sigma factor antagonist n=1 Tax=Catenulispora yoronensis TaxID=450799 RepID=A0ABP5F1Q0_9ACTN